MNPERRIDQSQTPEVDEVSIVTTHDRRSHESTADCAEKTIEKARAELPLRPLSANDRIVPKLVGPHVWMPRLKEKSYDLDQLLAQVAWSF